MNLNRMLKKRCALLPTFSLFGFVVFMTLLFVQKTCYSQSIVLTGNVSPSYNGTDDPWAVQSLDVGRNASGSVDISDGAQVTSRWGYIGTTNTPFAFSNSDVKVTGSGSRWTTQELIVGAASEDSSANGNLTIENNGRVISLGDSTEIGFHATTMIGAAFDSGSSTGNVTVTGNGSIWETGSLQIGFTFEEFTGEGFPTADGNLTISNGGRVESSNVGIGNPDPDFGSSNAFGSVVVTDTGSSWEVNQLTMGVNGESSLSIRNGAQLYVEKDLKIQSGRFFGGSAVDLTGGDLIVREINGGVSRFSGNILSVPENGFSMQGGGLSTERYAGDLVQNGGTLDTSAFGSTSISGTYHLVDGTVGFAIGGTNLDGIPLDPDEPNFLDEGAYSELSTPTVLIDGGTVDVNLVNGFSPQSGDSFQLLASGYQGTAEFDFDDAVLGSLLGNPLQWKTALFQSQGVLSVFWPNPNFNGDDYIDELDIDEYQGNIGQAATIETDQLDLNGDGQITLEDHDILVTTYAVTTDDGGDSFRVGTFLGDINLDGQVDVLGDGFILVGNLGQPASSWSDGDLNADGLVDVLGDGFRLVGNLGQNNSSSSVSSVMAVPEPDGQLLLICSIGVVTSLFRRTANPTDSDFY